MQIVPWIKPRAIELKPETVDTILWHVPTEREVLEELLEDASIAGEPFMIVAWRDEFGFPQWRAFTHKEMSETYMMWETDYRFGFMFKRTTRREQGL
jgi:Glycine cleavage system T protein (aminomethyltransferase)